MPEPVKYVASTESTRIPGFHDPADEELPKRPIIGDDPLISFETYHTQIRTDLSKWMTFDVEQRIEKAKKFSSMNRDPQRKVDEDRRAKILNYIIWMESHHPMGDSQPAAVAFKGLFPSHQPRQMKDTANAST